MDYEQYNLKITNTTEEKLDKNTKNLIYYFGGWFWNWLKDKEGENCRMELFTKLRLKDQPNNELKKIIETLVQITYFKEENRKEALTNLSFLDRNGVIAEAKKQIETFLNGLEPPLTDYMKGRYLEELNRTDIGTLYSAIRVLGPLLIDVETNKPWSKNDRQNSITKFLSTIAVRPRRRRRRLKY